MAWENVIAALGAALGLPDFHLDGEGGARLLFDGAMPVDLILDGESLVLGASPGRIPAYAREETLAALLAENRPDGDLDGAVFSLDRDGEGVTLSRRLVEGEEGELGETLSRFVETLALWRTRLDNGDDA
ncbi:MAG: type III secretion system chaperone [Planctomycetaceae bacterium]|nr:type III secretion system chaperone [Planctomycetaceae bacterium]